MFKVPRLVGLQGSRIQKFQKFQNFPRSQASGFNGSRFPDFHRQTSRVLKLQGPRILRVLKVQVAATKILKGKFFLKSLGTGEGRHKRSFQGCKVQRANARIPSSRVQGSKNSATGVEGTECTRFGRINVGIAGHWRERFQRFLRKIFNMVENACIWREWPTLTQDEANIAPT